MDKKDGRIVILESKENIQEGVRDSTIECMEDTMIHSSLLTSISTQSFLALPHHDAHRAQSKQIEI